MKQTVAVLLALIGAFATYSYWPELATEIPTDLDVTSDGWRYLATAVAAVLIWVLFRPRARRRPRRRPARSGSGWPKEGEYWMALVPYADGAGAKDRPCLVFKERGSVCDVLYITSQDKSGDNCYFKIDNFQWTGRVRNRDSWMRIAQRNGSDPAMQVPTHNFRRRLGRIALHDSMLLESHGLDIR